MSKVSALLADPIILSVGGGCCPLSVRMYVNFYYMGWGGRGAIQFQHTHLQPVPGLRGGGGGGGGGKAAQGPLFYEGPPPCS